MKSASLVAAACIAMSMSACAMDDPCAPRGDACGGDPSGAWSVMDSCRDPAYANPEAVTYYGQTQNMARQPPPEPTSSDWCSYLMYDPNKGITSSPSRTTRSASAPAASLRRQRDVRGPAVDDRHRPVDISAACLTRFSVHFQCAAATDRRRPVPSVTDDLTTYSVGLGSPEQNIVCVDDGSEGCFCSYDIASEPSGGGLSGRWSTQGSLLTHFAGTKLIPQQTDVCVSGDTMTIWGHNRAAIWDQAGLRTVTLQRMMTN